MRLVPFGVPLLCALQACASASSRASRTEPRPADWVPLIVEHDVVSPVELRVGDTLTLRPGLRNVSGAPVRISHGARLFVLEAFWTKSSHEAEASRAPLSFPPHRSWGEDRHREYPNPNAVYTTQLYVRVLQAGESYPASLLQRAEYRIPFDSAGTYAVRLCADVDSVRLCGRRDLTVVVR